MKAISLVPLALATMLAGCPAPAKPAAPTPATPRATGDAYPVSRGFVDTGDAFVYYEMVGRGRPLVFLHGGPNASHAYFLPWVLPLARHHRLVFLDERGAGRSSQLEGPKAYTPEAMAEDTEAVRRALGLGRIDLLGHSLGGPIAEAYAIRHQAHLAHLVLANTTDSAKLFNAELARIKAALPPDVAARIAADEKAGIWKDGRYTSDYQQATDAVFFPIAFGRKHPAGFSPGSFGEPHWDVYRALWGTGGEFHMGGTMGRVEYGKALEQVKTPTLIIVSDHDHCPMSLAQEMHGHLKHSKVVLFDHCGHMSMIDRPKHFAQVVDAFLGGR